MQHANNGKKGKKEAKKELLKGILILVKLLLESAVKTVRGALSIEFNWTVLRVMN